MSVFFIQALKSAAGAAFSQLCARYLGCEFKVLKSPNMPLDTATAFLGLGATAVGAFVEHLTPLSKAENLATRCLTAPLTSTVIFGVASSSAAKKFVQLSHRDAVILSLITTLCHLAFRPLVELCFNLKQLQKEQKNTPKNQSSESANEIKTLQTSLLEEKQKIEALKKQNEKEASSLRQKLEEEKIKFETSNNLLKKQLAETTTKLEELKIVKQQIETTLSSKKKEYEAQLKTVQWEYEEKISKIKKEQQEKTHEEIDKLNPANDPEKKQLEQLSENHQATLKQLQETQEKTLSTLNEEKQHIEKQCKKLVKEVKTLQENLLEEQKKIVSLKKQNETEINNLSQQLEKEKKKFEESSHSLKEQLEEITKKLQEKEDSYQRQIQTLTIQSNNKDQTFKSLLLEKYKVEETLTTKEKEYESKVLTLEKEKEELKKEIARLNQALDPEKKLVPTTPTENHPNAIETAAAALSHCFEDKVELSVIEGGHLLIKTTSAKDLAKKYFHAVLENDNCLLVKNHHILNFFSQFAKNEQFDLEKIFQDMCKENSSIAAAYSKRPVVIQASNQCAPKRTVAATLACCIGGLYSRESLEQASDKAFWGFALPIVMSTVSGDLMIAFGKNLSETAYATLIGQLQKDPKVQTRNSCILPKEMQEKGLYEKIAIIPKEQLQDFLSQSLFLDDLPKTRSTWANELESVRKNQTEKIDLDCLQKTTVKISEIAADNITLEQAKLLLKESTYGSFIVVQDKQKYQLIVKTDPSDRYQSGRIVNPNLDATGIYVLDCSAEDELLAVFDQIDLVTHSVYDLDMKFSKYFAIKQPLVIDGWDPKKVEKLGFRLKDIQKEKLLLALGTLDFCEYGGKYVLTTFDKGMDYAELNLWIEQISHLNLKKSHRTNLTRLFIRLFGHAHGLKGEYKIGDSKVNLEGNWSDIATSFIAQANIDFLVEDASSVERMVPQELQADLIEMSSKIPFYSLRLDWENNLKRAERVYEDLLAGKSISFSTGWYKHAVNVTIAYGHLGYTNRGARAFEKANGPQMIDHKGDLMMYTIDPTKLPQKTDTPDERRKKIETLATFMSTFERNKKENKDKYSLQLESTGDSSMHQMLGLQFVGRIPKTPQKVGNCSFSNNKASPQSAVVSYYLKQGNDLKTAQRLAHLVFKSIEIRDRKEKVKQFLALGEKIEKKELAMDRQTHMQILMNFLRKYSKLGVKYSQIQNRRAIKYDPYRKSEIYKNSRIPHYMQEMDQTIKKFLSESPCTLLEASAGVMTHEEAKKIINNNAYGCFVLHTTPDSSIPGSIYLTVKIKHDEFKQFTLNSSISLSEAIKKIKTEQNIDLLYPCMQVS